MPQFFVPQKNLEGIFFTFPPSESHHLAKVLRKKVGDRVQIFNGKGWVCNAEIIDVSNPHKVQGKIIEQVKIKKTSSLEVHLYPALIRKERFEWLLEKVTELGVSSIHPILTQRTIVRCSKNRAEEKLNRWKKILLSAAKQSKRECIPQIFPPMEFSEAIRLCENRAINLILWEREEKNSLSNFLKTNHLSHTTFNLFIGPEGGFTLEEVESAKRIGFHSISLNENILRAETAAIAAVSLALLH